MDSFLANITTVAIPIIAFFGSIWAMFIMIRSQLEHFNSTINDLKETIKKFTEELKGLINSQSKFEIRLKECERRINCHDSDIDGLRHYHMEKE